jgi:hypothetical protein
MRGFLSQHCNAVNHFDTKVIILKEERAGQQYEDAIWATSLLRRLHVALLKQECHSWGQTSLDRQWGGQEGKLRDDSIISALMEEYVHAERSTGRKEQLSVLVFFFALFLIFDFYCGFKAFFSPARTLQWMFLNQLVNKISVLSNIEKCHFKNLVRYVPVYICIYLIHSFLVG